MKQLTDSIYFGRLCPLQEMHKTVMLCRQSNITPELNQSFLFVMLISIHYSVSLRAYSRILWSDICNTYRRDELAFLHDLLEGFAPLWARSYVGPEEVPCRDVSEAIFPHDPLALSPFPWTRTAWTENKKKRNKIEN
jgi:hypothetical protein